MFHISVLVTEQLHAQWLFYRVSHAQCSYRLVETHIHTH